MRPTAGEGDAIRRMAARYTEAIARGDRERFASFFSEDIVVMPPGQPAIRGREAARAFAAPLFDRFTMQETIAYDELHVDGDWAAGTFSYTLSVTPKAGGAASTERGKAMVWLKRAPDGAWRFSRWIWNQDHSP